MKKVEASKRYDTANRILVDFGQTSGDPGYFNSDMGGPENMWHQDCAAMKAGHWSGIIRRGNAYEDFVVQENMGAIVDRSRNISAPATASSIAPAACSSKRSSAIRPRARSALQATPSTSAAIRAVSCAYPRDRDWRDIETYVAQALAAE
nr:hypothetical protein [Sphingobium nicotianae]